MQGHHAAGLGVARLTSRSTLTMDYKAKYEEALERAKRWADGTLQPECTTPQGVCEAIFPELRESEDERTRKEIIGFIQSQIEDGNSAGWDRWIAWLEKQKEQKPCLTCDEYDKGYKQGYTEGCTAGYNKAMKEQPKQEWSEKDTEMYINVASSLRGYACGLENEEHKKHIKKGLDWLENRFISLRPQPKKKTIWQRAKAGTLFPSEALVIGYDGEARLSKVAVNDCWYILVKKLLPGEDGK